jgi:hypothetical protein
VMSWKDQRTPCTFGRGTSNNRKSDTHWRLWGPAGESSLIGGSFFLSRKPLAYLAWFLNHGSHLLPLHYDSLELTAEIFPSRVLAFAAHLIQELSGYQSLQASTSGRRIQHLPQPTCWNDLVMVGHEISRSPVKSPFLLLDVFHPRHLQPMSQVTAITLPPLQHCHLAPSFSTFSNLPCPPCKQLACIAATLTTGSFPIYSLLKYLSLPLKNVSIHFVHCLKSL